MLQLIPADDSDVGGKDALLPALRAGIDSAEAFSLADGRAPRRRRALNRLRFADLGLRPFRVF
jgi:hypothetical protein